MINASHPTKGRGKGVRFQVQSSKWSKTDNRKTKNIKFILYYALFMLTLQKIVHNRKLVI